MKIGGYDFDSLQEGTLLKVKKAFGLTNTGNFQSYNNGTNRFDVGNYLCIVNIRKHWDPYYKGFAFLSFGGGTHWLSSRPWPSSPSGPIGWACRKLKPRCPGERFPSKAQQSQSGSTQASRPCRLAANRRCAGSIRPICLQPECAESSGGEGCRIFAATRGRSGDRPDRDWSLP